MKIFGAKLAYKIAATITTGVAGLALLFAPNPNASLDEKIVKEMAARNAQVLSRITPNNYDKVWVIPHPEIESVALLVPKHPIVVDQNDTQNFCVQYQVMYFTHNYDKAQQMTKIRSFESANAFCHPYTPDDEPMPSREDIFPPAGEVNLPNADLG